MWYHAIGSNLWYHELDTTSKIPPARDTTIMIPHDTTCGILLVVSLKILLESCSTACAPSARKAHLQHGRRTCSMAGAPGTRICRMAAGRIFPNRCLLRAASGAVQPGLNAVKRAIPSRLGRPLSPFHPPSRPHGGPTRPPLPLLVWTRRALSCLRKPPKQLSPGGRQVPLSPLEWELPCLLNGSSTGNTHLSLGFRVARRPTSLEANWRPNVLGSALRGLWECLRTSPRTHRGHACLI